jgi:hypothetical protein
MVEGAEAPVDGREPTEALVWAMHVGSIAISEF